MFCRILITLLAAILLIPLAAPGAEVNTSWETLAGTAKIGRKIVITRMNSASLEGKLVSVGDQSITIQQRDGNQAIPRADVFRVRYVRGGHPPLLGALIGAATGAIGLWAADRATSDKPRANEAVGLGMVLGGAAGAIVGACVPEGATLFQVPGRPILRR